MQLQIISLDSKGFGKAKDKKGNIYKILGALPGEIVIVDVFKKTKNFIYANIKELIKSSDFRIKPKDPESYLSSSVWQILNLEKENEFKKNFLIQEFEKHIKNFSQAEKKTIQNLQIASQEEKDSWNYRNKVELQFYQMPNGEITYAFYKQGESWEKLPFKTAAIFYENINKAAIKILNFINEQKIDFDDLRYLILRSSSKGLVALLCTKNLEEIKDKIQDLLDENIKGFLLAAPVADSYKIVYEFGDCDLQDKLLDKNFIYNFEHFFQVNIPVFEQAIQDILNFLNNLNLKKHNLILVDLFAGVGVIGQLLESGFKKVIGVEISKSTKGYALKNAEINKINNFEFYESDIDNALEVVSEADVLIVDPPRGGLTKSCIESIKNSLPKYIVYLSCNHETFVSNLVELSQVYEVKFLKAYNFFPHTPHIECLAILQRRWG